MNLSTFKAEVFINTPADLPVLDFYLQRGAVDFFTASESWQVTNTVNVLSGADTFTVPTVTNGSFIKLVSIELTDVVLTGKKLDEFCSTNESGQVSLAKPADGDITLRVTCVYAPTGSEIDDAIGRQYRDGIISATLTKLFMLPKKPWTDFNLAEFHRNKWQSMAATAKRHAYIGKQRVPIRSTTHFIGGR